MAGATGIEWADATFNPWWGCERVSPACAHCYADTFARRIGMPDLWPNSLGKPHEHGFRFFGDKHWAEPLKWARLLPAKLGRRPRVFCASMADVFEERPELDEPRVRLLNLIAATPELDWLLLTKRPEFARDWLPYSRPRPNVWLGVSIENARYTWRADILREIPAAVRFISAEPLLDSLFEAPSATRRDGDAAARRLARPASDADGPTLTEASARRGVSPLDLSGIDWVIIGGESGPKSRPFHLDHAREIIRVARDLGEPTLELVPGGVDVWDGQRIAVFVKQFGAKPVDLTLRDRKGGDWTEWPADLRIREFPTTAAVPA